MSDMVAFAGAGLVSQTSPEAAVAQSSCRNVERLITSLTQSFHDMVDACGGVGSDVDGIGR